MRSAKSLPGRFWRWGIALLLIPWSVGLSIALGRVIQATGAAVEFWSAVLGGVALWIVTFLLLPKPMWIYVFGHELTHALWAWLFGGRVRSFKATAKGGHVVLTKANSLITLAPYFFPLYAVLWVAAFASIDLFWGGRLGHFWLHLGLGITYAFHVSLTAHVLRLRQPDIVQEGWFFSVILIWLGNVLVLLLILPPLTHRVGILTALGWAIEETGRLVGWLGRLL